VVVLYSRRDETLQDAYWYGEKAANILSFVSPAKPVPAALGYAGLELEALTDLAGKSEGGSEGADGNKLSTYSFDVSETASGHSPHLYLASAQVRQVLARFILGQQAETETTNTVAATVAASIEGEGAYAAGCDGKEASDEGEAEQEERVG
jgi:hypothetical protein